MLVDTHCHLNMIVKAEFDVPLAVGYQALAKPVVQAAMAASVTKIVNVGTNLIESRNCVRMAQDFANCYATIGIHPNDLTSDWRSELTQLSQLLKAREQNKILGIGECGIDLHYPEYNLARQQDALRVQIELALEYDLALVVHSRAAYDETLRVLEEYAHENIRGILHCFSADQAFADQVIAWGYFLGIGGTVTYPKNEKLREIVQQVGLKHLVLETDAPFLAPQAVRGQKNYPQYVKLISEYIAALQGVSGAEVAQITTANAQQIFRF